MCERRSKSYNTNNNNNNINNNNHNNNNNMASTQILTMNWRSNIHFIENFTRPPTANHLYYWDRLYSIEELCNSIYTHTNTQKTHSRRDLKASMRFFDAIRLHIILFCLRRCRCCCYYCRRCRHYCVYTVHHCIRFDVIGSCIATVSQ